jgi:hypothetical protein
MKRRGASGKKKKAAAAAAAGAPRSPLLQLDDLVQGAVLSFLSPWDVLGLGETCKWARGVCQPTELALEPLGRRQEELMPEEHRQQLIGLLEWTGGSLKRLVMTHSGGYHWRGLLFCLAAPRAQASALRGLEELSFPYAPLCQCHVRGRGPGGQPGRRQPASEEHHVQTLIRAFSADEGAVEGERAFTKLRKLDMGTVFGA